MSDIESFVARQRERFTNAETERQISAVRAAIEALDPGVKDRRFMLPADCELSSKTIDFFRTKGLAIAKLSQSGQPTHLYSFDFLKVTPAFDSQVLWTPVTSSSSLPSSSSFSSSRSSEDNIQTGWPHCDGWCSWGCVHPNPCKCNGK